METRRIFSAISDIMLAGVAWVILHVTGLEEGLKVIGGAITVAYLCIRLYVGMKDAQYVRDRNKRLVGTNSAGPPSDVRKAETG